MTHSRSVAVVYVDAVRLRFEQWRQTRQGHRFQTRLRSIPARVCRVNLRCQSLRSTGVVFHGLFSALLVDDNVASSRK